MDINSTSYSWIDISSLYTQALRFRSWSATHNFILSFSLFKTQYLRTFQHVVTVVIKWRIGENINVIIMPETLSQRQKASHCSQILFMGSLFTLLLSFIPSSYRHKVAKKPVSTRLMSSVQCWHHLLFMTKRTITCISCSIFPVSGGRA